MPSQALTVHCRAATTASKSPTSRVVARRQSSQNQRFTWFSAPRLVAFTPNLGAGSRVLTKPAECPRILIRVQPPDPARELHGRGVSLQQTDDCASFRIIDDRSGFRLGAGCTASRWQVESPISEAHSNAPWSAMLQHPCTRVQRTQRLVLLVLLSHSATKISTRGWEASSTTAGIACTRLVRQRQE